MRPESVIQRPILNILLDKKKLNVFVAITTASAIGFVACASTSDTFRIRTWTTGNGTPVPPSIIQLRTGAPHCGWEDVWFLTIGNPVGSERQEPPPFQFIQDPDGQIPAGRLADEFDADVELPLDAEFTGFVTEGDQLWVSPSQFDEAVYMLNQLSQVEKWPRAEPSLVCD